ncbi:Protein PROLIFERA, partial [Tetrabaena socialis]
MAKRLRGLMGFPPLRARRAGSCAKFLTNFMDPEDESRAKYLHQLQEIANRRSKVLRISLDDVEAFFEAEEPKLVGQMEQNTRTYQKLIAEAADTLMPPPDVTAAGVKKDVYDILSEH